MVPRIEARSWSRPDIEGALAARLSKEAKAPVRIMLTRFDEALAVGNRPSSFQKIKLGAKEDGTLYAYQLDSYGTAGIVAGGPIEGGGVLDGEIRYRRNAKLGPGRSDPEGVTDVDSVGATSAIDSEGPESTSMRAPRELPGLLGILPLPTGWNRSWMSWP